MVVLAVCSLLLGVGPMSMPTAPALVSLTVGVAGLSAATVVLGQGRIAVGDRLRWTYGSIGELLIRNDVDGVAVDRREPGVAGELHLGAIRDRRSGRCRGGRGANEKCENSMTDAARIVATPASTAFPPR